MVTYVEEKPKSPKSNFAITGLYMFDSQVFDILKNLKPSWRDEIEIADAMAAYVKKKQLYYNIIKGFWSDAGTFESLFRATEYMANKQKGKS